MSLKTNGQKLGLPIILGIFLVLGIVRAWDTKVFLSPDNVDSTKLERIQKQFHTDQTQSGKPQANIQTQLLSNDLGNGHFAIRLIVRSIHNFGSTTIQWPQLQDIEYNVGDLPGDISQLVRNEPVTFDFDVVVNGPNPFIQVVISANDDGSLTSGVAQIDLPSSYVREPASDAEDEVPKTQSIDIDDTKVVR